MNPFMNLQVFGPGEKFSTSWKRTGERFLPSMDPDNQGLLIKGWNILRFSGNLQGGGEIGITMI